MRVYVAMGSNIDPRAEFLKQAKTALGRIAVENSILESAPIYSSAPVNCPPGAGEFFNTVVSFDWRGVAPLALLDALQEIERSLGRIRGEETTRNAPRTIDLDLLFTDQGAFNHPRLTLPHPRLAQRRFVLQPLADIAREICPEADGPCVDELLANLDSAEPPLGIVSRHW